MTASADAAPSDSAPYSRLAEEIKARARTLGFALCGITTAEPPPHHRHYARWLAEGRAGEMLYLHRQEPKRGDLQQVLPGAQSVVCVALAYATADNPAPADNAEAPTGVVARYARFPDYHDLLWERLTALLSYIQALRPDAQGKIYCDTGPVTERDLAMRAGLGWIGKHTNLLSRQLGNWLFLGEILLTIPLPPDPPETTHCGTCERCLPACPTGAITGPYALDARRCISYLTIELKGSIPEDLRPLVGNRIYGCDDCLAACPWNKFAPATVEDAVKPRADLTQPDLLALLALDDDGFRARFARSPIARAKRRGLLRNVCVALGNIGDVRAVPALRRAAADPEPLIREHALWALGEIARRAEA